jgi:4-amino-4-deoxy-L-arabinose transferase-like glycosyltransferase
LHFISAQLHSLIPLAVARTEDSAAIIAFAFATSAGFIAYAHFLTVDIPLLFWMMAALWATYRLPLAPGTWNYAIAGFLIGIAIATKYNGLAVGIALLVAHFFATKRREPSKDNS